MSHQHGCRCCECDDGFAIPPIPNAKALESLFEQRSDLMKRLETAEARVAELERENAYLKRREESLLRQVQTINPLAR